MVGCRHDAKNSLDKNYLYLAEKLGVRIIAKTRAVGIEPDGQGGYVVRTRRSIGRVLGRARRPDNRILARQVIVSAGALGTVDLLLSCKHAGTLPNLSPTVGQHIRTNSEIIAGARSRKLTVDHAQGIAIASNLETSPDTHVQIVRYPAGSDMMGLLGTLAAGGSRRGRRIVRWLGRCLRHPVDFLRNLWPFGWARRTVVVLVMQSLDNAMTLVRKERAWLGRNLRSRRADGVPPIPTYLPVANQAAAYISDRMGGFPLNALNEVLLGVPITAHILGGARMADAPERGVVDGACRVFGHPGLWIVDGSVIPVNLGANPSLTITAVAEYAMSLVPRKK
jgi:cholesterol oxidase